MVAIVSIAREKMRVISYRERSRTTDPRLRPGPRFEVMQPANYYHAGESREIHIAGLYGLAWQAQNRGII